MLLFCDTSCIILYSFLLFIPLPVCFFFVILPALFLLLPAFSSLFLYASLLWHFLHYFIFLPAFYPSSCMLLFVTLPALFCIPSCFFIPLPVSFFFVILPPLFLLLPAFSSPFLHASLLYQHLTPRSYYKITHLFSYPSFVLLLFSPSFLSPFSFLFILYSFLSSFFLPFHLSPLPCPLCPSAVFWWVAGVPCYPVRLVLIKSAGQCGDPAKWSDNIRTGTTNIHIGAH
jgi:hypothetical protein